MGDILEFKSKAEEKLSGRDRFAVVMTEALEALENDPEMRVDKFEAAIDVFDRFCLPVPIEVTIEIPPGEPALTPGQIEAFTKATEKVLDDFRKRSSEFLKYIRRLQFENIELRATLREQNNPED
jgi:hypothetical protein